MNPKLRMKDRLLEEILEELDQHESIKLKPQAQAAVTSTSEPGDIHEKGAEANARSTHDPETGQDIDVIEDDDMDKESLRALLEEYLAQEA